MREGGEVVQRRCEMRAEAIERCGGGGAAAAAAASPVVGIPLPLIGSLEEDVVVPGKAAK